MCWGGGGYTCFVVQRLQSCIVNRLAGGGVREQDDSLWLHFGVMKLLLFCVSSSQCRGLVCGM